MKKTILFILILCGSLFSGDLLLDTYPNSAVAYSLRKLDKDYAGYAIKVCDKSDSSLHDIGFVEDDLDISSLESAIGTNWAYIDTWYDQSGNGYDLTPADTSVAPVIMNGSGVIYLDGVQAVSFDGSDDLLQTSGGAIGAVSSSLTFFLLGAFDETSQANATMFGSSAGAYGGASDFILFRQVSGNNQLRVKNSADETTENGASDTNQHLYYGNLVLSTNLTLGVDGSNNTETATVTSSFTVSAELDVGAYESSGTPAGHGDVKIQEFVVYKSDQSSNQTAIELNINTWIEEEDDQQSGFSKFSDYKNWGKF